MNLNEYQAKLIELWGTSPDCNHLLFCAVGMAEEAGEALGKVKRLMRGDGFDREGYLLELGDCLAYLTMAAHEKGWTFDDSFRPRSKRIDGIIPNTVELLSTANALLQDIYEEGDDPEWTQELFADVLQQLSLCVNSQEIKGTLEEVMQLNIVKLEDRITRLGTLKGSGDNR